MDCSSVATTAMPQNIRKGNEIPRTKSRHHRGTNDLPTRDAKLRSTLCFDHQSLEVAL